MTARPHFTRFIPVLLALGLVSAAYSQSGGPPGQPPFQQQPSTPTFFDSRDQVTTSIEPAFDAVTPGSDLPLAVTFTMNPGWHIWTQAGGVPERMDEFDGAQYTTINLSASDAAPIRAAMSAIQWPEFHSFAADQNADGEPERYAVFDGRAVAYVPLIIDEHAEPGEYTVTVELEYQTCDDSSCLAPATEKLNFTVTVEPGEPRYAVNETFTGAFGDMDLNIFTAARAANITPISADVSSEPAPAGISRPTLFGIEIPSADGPGGIVVLALLAALGGLVLNLTPCVLPVIPIKVMTISQHAGTPGRSLVLGLWMALGVVAFWAGIGVPVAFVSSITDPSIIFGIWWLTLGIGLVIGVMGFGIMGMFSIQLPQSAYMINPKADSPWGSFVFGVMTAVLGLPCFGFVAGALLAGAATLPASTVMTIFTSLGVGMALPYLVLAVWPKLVDRIPRTGPASELVKQVMGLLLIAAALFFIGSGLIALVSEKPYLARQLHWWAIAACAVFAGGLLMIRTIQLTPHLAPRIVFSLAGIIVGGIAVLYVMQSTAKARTDWMAKQEAIAESGGIFTTKAWNDYSPAAVAAAREQGHIVVLDFTAEWCLNCKALKAAVLNPDPVKSLLAEDDIVAFTVDLTSRSAPGWTLLKDELGQTGIPMLAIYTPGDDTPWMSNGYTANHVVAAIEDARTSRVAKR